MNKSASNNFERNFFSCKEFKLLECDDDGRKKLEKFISCHHQSEAERVGVYFNLSGKIQASHWVGAVWIDDSLILSVRPKRIGCSGKAFEIRLLEECLKFPVIASRLFSKENEVFAWWPEEKKIETEGENTSGTIFLVIQYLHKLKQLCRRHIKRKFPRVNRNLTAKVKGRIDITGNIRRNTVRGRPDRIFCNFNIHSVDILENRILKAALEVSKTFLRACQIDASEVWAMARECDTALASVSLQRIMPRHFRGIVLSGTMKPYETPLKLAEEIMKHLGSEPDFERQQQNKSIFPYAINMNELFERYCEAMLRQGNMTDESGKTFMPEKIWPGDVDLGDPVKVRPDFLFWHNDVAVIADAKYKYDWIRRVSNTTDDASTRPDVYQVMAYTRHKAVQEKLKAIKSSNDSKDKFEKFMAIYIFYPYTEEEKKAGEEMEEIYKTFDDFDVKIHAIPVSLPY